MNMMFFIAKVTWYDEASHPGPATDNIAICAESFESATAQIMTYFGEDVENINLTLLNPSRPLLLIDNDTYDGLKRSEC